MIDHILRHVLDGPFRWIDQNVGIHMTRSAQNPRDRQRSLMSHHSPRRRPATFTSLIALTATLVAASLGLAACGGSSSTTTTTETTANAAATGTTTNGTSTSGATSTGTSSTGTSPTRTSSTGTTPGASTTGATPAARSARFAAVRTCLSKKGITLPQRGAGGFAGGAGGSGAQLPKGMSQAQFAEALRSCGSGFNGSHYGKGARGFHNPFNNPRFHAVLLRFAACLRQNGVDIGEPDTTGKGPVFATKGINTGSPQFKAAAAKCRGTLLGALKSNRAHPGASAG